MPEPHRSSRESTSRKTRSNRNTNSSNDPRQGSSKPNRASHTQSDRHKLKEHLPADPSDYTEERYLDGYAPPKPLNSYSTAYKNRNDYGEECMDNDFENETRETPGYPNSYGPIGTRFDHSPSVPMHDTRYPSRHCAAGDGFSRSLNANPLYSTPSPYMHDVTRQVFPWPSNADPKYSPRSGSMRAAGIRAATSSSNAHFKHSIRSDSMNKVGRQALEEPPKASALHFSPVASSDRVQPSYAYMTHQPPLSYGTQYSPVQNHPVSPSPSSSQSLLLYPTPRGAPPPQLYPCPQPPPDPGRTFRLSASSSSLNQPKKRSNIDPKAEYQLCEMDGKPYRNEESDKLAWYNISLIKVGTFHSFQYPEIYQWRYNADEKELSLKNKDQVKEGIGVVSNSVITKPWVVELMKIRNVSGSVTYQPDVRAGLVAHVLTNNCYNVAKKCSENLYESYIGWKAIRDAMRDDCTRAEAQIDYFTGISKASSREGEDERRG